jgi:Alpha/beta hydrolase
MTLALADVEAWDDQAIDQVFAAAMSRAEGAQTTGDTVGDLLTFVKWDGAAAAVARDSANRIKVTLSDHADQCRRVAAAAQKAAAEVASLKYRLPSIKAEADEAQLQIDDQTGAVTSKVTVLTVEMRKHQDAVKQDVEARIKQLLADANGVDRDLATAIQTADGAATGLDPRGPPPNLPKPPPASASPRDVKKWWDGLTPQQQTDYIAHDPAAIDRDGIPVDIRDAGNRIRLPHELAAAKRTLDQAQTDALHSTNDTGFANAQALANAQTRYNDLLAIENSLYPTNPNGTSRTIDPNDRRSLVMLDTTSNQLHVLGAIGIGDVDHAAHLGVTVGGVGTNATSLPGMVDEATNLRHTTSDILRQAGDLNPNSLATVAWVGYEPPASMTDLRVGDDSLARAAAPHLNSFWQGLAVTTENPHQEITAFGHSYGSLVTSLALQQGSPVKDVVLYGSPGLELNNVGDLHLAPGGHAFYEQAGHDPIVWMQKAPQIGEMLLPALAVPPLAPLGVLGLVDVLGGSGVNDQWFGNTPNQVAGITQLSTAPGIDPELGINRIGASVHADYPRADSNGVLRMSGYNLAAVLSGVPGATKTGN